MTKPDPRRSITYRKSRFKKRAKTASSAVSRLFRKVALGGEIEMGEVYDLAGRLVKLGRSLEEIAQVAADLDMASEVLSDLAHEAMKLHTYSTGLKKVSEAYFKFPVKALPVYEPSMPKQGQEVKVVAKSIKGLIENLEG